MRESSRRQSQEPADRPLMPPEEGWTDKTGRTAQESYRLMAEHFRKLADEAESAAARRR